MSKHTRRLSPLLTLTCASLLLACTTVPGGKQATSGSGGQQEERAPCVEAPSPPELTELKARELPPSEIWLDAKLPTQALLNQLSRQLPQPLAQAKSQPVGAPGKATYKVTHHTPGLKNTKQGLELSLPIRADISVCKPLGRSCFRYGSCQPAFEARIAIANQWDKHYRLAAPRARIFATKKCVIGMDVTPQIEKIARAETAKVERQIHQQWPRTENYARAAWGELSRAISISKASCVHLSPDSVLYSPLRVDEHSKKQWLIGGLGIRGVLSPAKDCKSQQPLPSLPPSQVAASQHEDSRLWVPQALSFDDIEQGLKKGIEGSWGKNPKNELVITETRFGTQGVALLIESQGDVCGSIWIWGRLAYKKGGHQIYLELDGHTDLGTSEELSAPLLQHLKTKSGFKVDTFASFNASRAEEAIAQLTRHLPKEVTLKVSKLKLPQTEVRLDRDGPLLLHEVTAQIEVSDLNLSL